MADTKEARRLDVLRQLDILDTDPSENFDRITRMASQIFGLPIAAVSLTDKDRQWFKSRVGVTHDNIPRGGAPCAEVSDTGKVLVVEDFSLSECYSDCLLADSGVRFYAGAPLTTREGYNLGALCVLGTEPRVATPAEIASLEDLAAMVMSQIEMQHSFGRVDAISGLPNRLQFLDDLEDMARDRAGERRIAVLVDLAESEQLKNFNRVLGPGRIDEMVSDTAALLRRAVGSSRRTYHVSATQFAFLAYEGAILEQYVKLAETILVDMQTKSEIRLMVTGVLGVTEFVLGEQSPMEILRSIQSAVDDARSAGIPVAIHDVSKDDQHRRRFVLLQDFEAAVASSDQLRLVYQPRVRLSDARIIGAEALLRWNHPELGGISPGEFVPIIEHSSQAREMTEWVLGTALSQMATWKASGFDIDLSVNISTSNLEEPDFFDRVTGLLAEHGIDPARLELEVTESAIMKDATAAIERLGKLSGAGIRLAIDDFGTGHSSLAYLQRLPADVVKIDQAFVRDLEVGERERTLVTTMIGLSHDLGYRVVAEGIETEDAAMTLLSMGCDEGQGYHFARPLETRDFERLAFGSEQRSKSVTVEGSKAVA